nr:MAG TPA: hypothetical protein [Bacteriophage sp.]
MIYSFLFYSFRGLIIYQFGLVWLLHVLQWL